jgi:hypothetical protein
MWWHLGSGIWLLLSGSNEFLELKVFGIQHALHSIAEQVRVLTVIESPAHFVKVGLQVLCTKTVPCTDNPALEKRECRLYGIRVHVAVNVNAILVLDSLVLGQHSSLSDGAWVSAEVVP